MTPKKNSGSSSLEILPQVVLQEQPHLCSYTHLISQEQDLLLMLVKEKKTDNSTD